MRNALILDCEQRLGAMMRGMVAGMVAGVSLVTREEDAHSLLAAGKYDVGVISGVTGAVAEELVQAAEQARQGTPIILVRGLVESSEPVPVGEFAAVIDEPFSERRFRDVVLALLAAPELVKERRGRRRQPALQEELAPRR